MNIIVIGSVRTKSTALIKYLTKQYPKHLYWGEPLFELTLKSDSPIIKNKQQFIESQMKAIFDTLFSSTNNIIKILGINLYGMYRYIDKIHLEKFDLIYLIERNDFFDQVCSITLAKKTRIYHKTKNTQIQLNQYYTVNKDIILSTALDVYNYIMIKNILVRKKISFIQFTYETMQDVDNISIIPNNFNYSEIVTNYDIKTNINNLFYKYFDYQTMKADISGFMDELNNLPF